MAADLSGIGSIATFIIGVFQVPTGVSGNMIEIVDMARQHVANYTGETIGSLSILAEYQPAIVDFSKADTIDLIQAQAGGETIKLAELTIAETGEEMSAEQYRLLGEMKLKSLGRKVYITKSLGG